MSGTLDRRKADIAERSGMSCTLTSGVLLVAMLVVTPCLGASGNRWSMLADHDITFAKELAAERVKFGPAFMREIVDGKTFEFGCNPRPSRLSGLSDSQVRQLRLYSEHHCNPWVERWSEMLSPCEAPVPPGWCSVDNQEGLAAHLRIEPYFEGLVGGMQVSTSRLVRYNVMAVIADRLRDKFLADYPEGVMGEWVTRAATVFCEDALPEDVVAIGWSLHVTPFGTNRGVAAALRGYADRVRDMKTEQRNRVDALARGFEGETLPEEVRAQLNELNGYGKRNQQENVDAPLADPMAISQLVRRVNEYYRMMKDGRLPDSWDMLALDYREERSRDDYVRTTKRIESSSPLVSWTVYRIRVHGSVARVDLVTRRMRGKSPESEVTRDETSYWNLEGDTWFNMIKWPTNWDDKSASEAPLPQSGSLEPSAATIGGSNCSVIDSATIRRRSNSPGAIPSPGTMSVFPTGSMYWV